MARPTDQFTEVLGFATRYWKLGSAGSPIVLIHGISCSVLEWEHVVNELSQQHQVFALDLLGHGLTAKPLDHAYDIESFGKFVLAFMDRMKLAQASLIGNSLGGRIAIECASLAPDRITSMVLSAPAAVSNPTLFEFRLASVPFLGELVTAPNTTGTGKIWRGAFADPTFATPGLIAEKVALAKMPGAGKAFLIALRNMLGLRGFKEHILKDTQEKLTRLRTKTMVIWGKQDRFLPISHLAVFMAKMPHAVPVVLEACGHAPMIERPREFNQHVLEFLNH
jgi:pimeloyl-ACP methyl ester carboxylesterase